MITLKSKILSIFCLSFSRVFIATKWKVLTRPFKVLLFLILVIFQMSLSHPFSQLSSAPVMQLSDNRQSLGPWHLLSPLLGMKLPQPSVWLTSSLPSQIAQKLLNSVKQFLMTFIEMSSNKSWFKFFLCTYHYHTWCMLQFSTLPISSIGIYNLCCFFSVYHCLPGTLISVWHIVED